MSDYRLVSTQWLEDHLDDPTLRILDVRGSVAGADAAADGGPEPHVAHYEDYLQNHIPGAAFVHWINDISDDANHLRIAPPLKFAGAMSRLGVAPDTLVVAYDDAGMSLAARLWWALRYYKHPRVAVLDGGWHKWLAEGRPTSDLPPSLELSEFPTEFDDAERVEGDEVLHLLTSAQILDLRSPDEFNAETTFARQPGHIPGAVNMPAGRLLRSDGTLLPPDVLRRRFAEAGFNGAQEIILYSDVGVDACLGLLALHTAGFDRGRIYDASWQEWGNDSRKPVEQGAG